MFGAPAEYIENTRLAKRSDFEVWDCNTDAVRLFLQCQTQWVVGMGGAQGLNYPGVESVLRLTRPNMDNGQIFDDLQAMELAALNVLSTRKAS